MRVYLFQCLCEDGEGGCQCVPYYQCDKSTGSVNQFGVGVIDIRYAAVG